MVDIEFPTSMTGETVTISGIMADASAVGDGEDITAEVMCQRWMIDWQSD